MKQPMNGGPGGKRPMGPPRKMNFGTLKRVIKLLFSYYPVLMPLTLLCIIFSAGVSAIPAIFQQQIIADIEIWYKTGDWEAASKVIIHCAV